MYRTGDTMSAKEKVETAVMKAVKLEAVPAERFGVMLQKTILGMLLAGIGVGGMLFLNMNHYLSVGLVAVGATVWSGQIVTGAVKALIQPLRDVLAAIRGRDA